MKTPTISFIFLLGVVTTALGIDSADAVTLATNGKATVTVVRAADATLDEQTAATELADYLGKVTGGQFEVSDEAASAASGAAVYVGPTQFSRKHGVDAASLKPEEWMLRTVGNDLVLVGGRPRGTLYAVYRFLEETVGVHWWSPWEESVPRKPTLRLENLNLRGKPVIPYRDIYMLYGNDGGRFAARNRLNRDGDARIKPEYGGCRDYGPPYHVHTFNLYFPPKEYGAQHPEWFSLINGKRVVETSQLCLTNSELRQAFLAKLINYIETTAATARAQGAPAPDVFSVSQNDWDHHCECDNCQAISKAEESEAGPLLDFVNFLADGIKDKYPWVYIDTLAYQYTQKAPKRIKPRDNVIIRLCDTRSDPTKSITSEANKEFREHLLSWAAIAKNLRVWDYAVTYANPVGMPMPTAQTYDDDYRFYKEHNVEGVFTELEYAILADMRDFKVWMMMKLLENPYADYDKLVRTFTDGFYGPAAGRLVRDYLVALEAEMVAKKSFANWSSTPMSLTYLNLSFINRAQRIFDEAERAVWDDAVLRRRVRHARLPLDRATVVTRTRLNSEWQALGQPTDPTPPSRDLVAQRAMDTWITQAKLRMSEAQQAKEKAEAEKEMRRYTSLPSSVPLPEKFRDRPKGTVFDYTADMTRNWKDVVKIVKDPEAESGFTNKLDLTAPETTDSEKYALPMPWGLYGVQQKKFIGGNPIKAEGIPGPGYHWYKMGSFAVEPSYYAYFFWSWIIQVDIDNAFDAGKPDQEFEAWARIKFEGPRFPHAKPDQKDAIYVERLVLVEVE
ncbi:MAG: hypothetical protein AUJ92_03225 [Armatimonadetes bacterium CG2_30_59_28]|nr:MAG: hypothetical protein AUJ92_03225 [Armatimonadetes bacterium CG2_30_59_28]